MVCFLFQKLGLVRCLGQAGFGAKFFFEDWSGYGKQRNSAIKKAKGKWILNIDADEEISSELGKRLVKIALEESEKEVFEIKEKMFITQINDIFYNIDDYKDKIIVVEGMYSKWNLWNGNKKVPVVYRNGPGCCGNDGWGGFWLNYDGELPKENDWIRVTGTPEIVTDDYCLYLYLNVTSLEVKTERGAEFVPQ